MTEPNKDGLRPASMADSEKTTAQSAPESTMESKAPSAREGDVETQGKAELAGATITSESGSGDGDEDNHIYPKGWVLAIITLALCLSVFCMALDNTIIATAIPRITDQFHAAGDVGWYGSAYLLTTCAMQLIFGKFYTFYSIKWVYLVALGIFEIGSLVCALAPNSNALIIGRAIAGVGGAGIFSGAILIVAHTVPLRTRPMYMGMIGGMYGIASVAGPLMGGAFTDHLTWRWCFYINLPFGAVTAAFIIPFFKLPRREEKDASLTWKQQITKFDLEGTACFLPAIVCLLLALTWGGSKYPWGNARIIALFVLFAVLISGFIYIQWHKGEDATVPPRVFLNRNVWGSALYASMLGGCFFVIVYYLPIWFQAIKGVSATKSGIMNLPAILGLVIISLLAGGIITVVGYYTPFMLVGSVFMAVGAGLLTTLEVDSGSPQWIGYQFIFGAGVGFGMQQSLIAVQTVLPAKDIPIGTAIQMFFQTLGGALMISVAQNVLNNQLVKNLRAIVPDLASDFVLRVGATEIKHKIPEQFLGGVIKAYNVSLTQTFYVSVACGAMSILGAAFVEWKSMKGKNVEMVGGA